MYGSKNEKRDRLEHLAELVALAPQGVTQAALARVLGVDRATVLDDVTALERYGVTILTARQVRQSQARAHRPNADHAPFTVEKLIAQPLPVVSQCPVDSWPGPNAVPQNTRQHLGN